MWGPSSQPLDSAEAPSNCRNVIPLPGHRLDCPAQARSDIARGDLLPGCVLSPPQPRICPPWGLRLGPLWPAPERGSGTRKGLSKHWTR